MGYVISYSGVRHYIGFIKHSAEGVAFFLSAIVLSIIIFPSIFLLYQYSGHGNSVDLIVKIVGAQWY